MLSDKKGAAVVTAYVLVGVVFISGSVLLNGFLYRYAENISGQSRSPNYAVYSERCLNDGTSYRTAGVMDIATTPTALPSGEYPYNVSFRGADVNETDWRADFNRDGDRTDVLQTLEFEWPTALPVPSAAVVAVHHAGICWQIISPDE